MLEMHVTAVRLGWFTMDQVPVHLQEKVAEELGIDWPEEEKEFFGE